MASTDARPVPIKNTAFRAIFPILDNTGALVSGAAGLDSEVSKDQGTFVDCTNEATEIATSSGIYYLDLTATEMNADGVAIIVKTSTTNAKTTVLTFYPQESGDIKVDVQSFNGTAGTFSGGRPEVNVSHITGDATAAGNLKSGTLGIVPGNAVTGTLSTTQMTTNLTFANTDQVKTRLLVFTSGTNVNRIATTITASTTGGLLTFDAIPAAPANNDTFVIV